MYIVYFKQAVRMLKENKFFSVVYISGTALAIVMVMALAILYYLRTANITPESHRDRLMVVAFGKIATKDGKGQGSGSLSFSTVKECFYPMKLPEAVSAVLPLGNLNEFIQVPGNPDVHDGLILGTDAGFWKVFQFTFISGTPYTEEEVTSAIPKVVVCESLARRLFNTADAAGKTLLLNEAAYTVAGVVKDVPSIARFSYAELWIPFTTRPVIVQGASWGENLLGRLCVYILAKSPADFEAIRQEADTLRRRYNTTTEKYDFVLNDQPDTVFRAYLHESDSWNVPDYAKLYLQIVLLVVVLLLVPSINLSGVMASRMKKRMEELGIRKAFGARNKTLLMQVLYENLLLTLLGGLLGLFISYGLVLWLKDWLLGNYNWHGLSLTASIDLSPGMFINPAIFGYTLFFCLVLNLLSALVPAMRALRRPIVDALNNK